MTQCDMILDHLRRCGSITQKEATDEYGCTRLSGRIYDLKQKGYQFGKRMDSRLNRFGVMTSFARYWLENDAVQQTFDDFEVAATGKGADDRA